MRKIGVLTSGGDAPGMNAAVRAIVRGGISKGMQVFGIQQGYEGLLRGEIREMDLGSVGDLIQRGGTVLRSARCKAFMTPEGMDQALTNIRKFGMEGLVVIGGDGTFRGGLDLSEQGIPVIGIPATIDNDLAYTEYSIGFDTAVNTVVEAIGKIRDTSTSHGRCIVVEVMGRHCGDIACYAGVAGGADFVLVPEQEEPPEEICRKLNEGKKRGKRHCIVVRAEGCKTTTEDLTRILEEGTGIETRSVVLGYIQRGGNPSARDRILASRTGYRAVELLAAGMESRVVGIRGTEIFDLDIREALAMRRLPNTELMNLAKILSI